MKKSVSWTLQILSAMLVLIVVSLNPLHASYNGECWVVSGGDTVYKLNADGLADPTIIPGLTQAQAAVVNPQNGVVWIAVSAANAVFRFDPAEQDPNLQFITLPPIERPHAVSVNPTDGTVWIGGINTVQKFSADGTQVLATVTGVHEPTVAVNSTDGSCWVTDSRGTIARYSAAGAAAATSPVKLREPKYVAVNSQSGNAWVTDPHGNVIVKLSPSGQELLRVADLKLPSSPSVNQKDGTLWVVADGNTLVKLSTAGQQLMQVPAGMAVLSICVSSQDGSVWVADQFGSTFQGGVSKFSADGQQLFENPIPQPSFVSVGNWAGQ
ncbi:hypothetical protein J4G02_02030 [Candidatus Poribacteria bacterium]|nr:hypothetical protein [Candidatus Poribacteria bacterium]